MSAPPDRWRCKSGASTNVSIRNSPTILAEIKERNYSSHNRDSKINFGTSERHQILQAITNRRNKAKRRQWCWFKIIKTNITNNKLSSDG